MFSCDATNVLPASERWCQMCAVDKRDVSNLLCGGVSAAQFRFMPPVPFVRRPLGPSCA